MNRVPIAVIGAGCRLPGGVCSPEQLWRFVLDGREAVGARSVGGVRQLGSFLADVAGFDAGFFGIPAREAAVMDPQHRIALEVAWEALEHAGVPASALAGTATAVFVGVGSDDYGRRTLADLPAIQPWTGIGASPCGAANRISHALDLRGPSAAVDSACSSSLVAVHQAMQALWADDEVPLAIAGGVLVVAEPGLGVVLDRAGATAPDGRSKPFSARADGYGRGEGCAFVVLKRLADAEAAGDRVLAVLRGGAVRQEGRTDGIMAPDRSAQADLLRAAYRSAGVDPATVDYVEAHGTGTPVGDPVEAGALGEVVAPCLIGSVKASIGHLEAAAGVAGLIMAVLAVHHGVIPPTRLAGAPNPAIDWAGTGLAVATEATPWPRTPRRAGVTSYGYGGTIAHLVVEQPPPTDPVETVDRLTVVPISGASPQAVRDNARRLAAWLDTHPEARLAEVGRTLATGRTHLPHRLAVVAEDRAELRAALDDVQPACPARSVDPVWVFSGHGSHWSGMGRDLLATEPVFAEVLDKLEPVYTDELGRSARDLLTDADLGATHLAQAAIFAVQVGLAELWRAHGVRPAAVVGHSVGELAAAVATGALPRQDAARLACRRALLLRGVAGRGAMAMVALPFAEAGPHAAIAASPTSTVVAADPAEIERLVAAGARRVDTDVAFHSPHMLPLCADLARAARDLCPAEPEVPLYSTALLDPRSTAPRDAAYWVRNLRDPVRLVSAITAAAEDGHRLFLEVSGHPVVAHSIAETVPDAVVVPTLRRGAPGRRAFLTAAAALHEAGVDLDWSVLHPAGPRADLPTTAWQHRRHWALASGDTEHTLLGEPAAAECWRRWLTPQTRPYPGSHPVLGSEIVPAAVLLSTLFAAAGVRSLRSVELRVPIAVEPREVQVEHRDGRLRISSRRHGDWQTHTEALVGHDRPAGRVEQAGEPIDPSAVRARLAALGVADMGFDWAVEDLRTHRHGGYARVRAGSWAAILDAALSTAAALADTATLRMPARIASAAITGPAPDCAQLAVRRVGEQFDVAIARSSGEVVGVLRGLRLGSPDGDAPPPIRRPAWVAVEPSGPDHAAELFRAGSGDPIDLVDELRRALAGARGRLWCLTRGAREARTAEGLAHNALWGFGRVAATEHPDVWGGVVDLPAQPTADDEAALRHVLDHRWDVDVLAISGGRITAATLVPAEPGEGITCDPAAAYLVTGGTGALGAHIARWLVRRGARTLVVLGRSGRRVDVDGARVHHVRADVADEEALARIRRRWPLRGVVHAAGVADNRRLRDLDEATLRAVLHPKITGTAALHRAFPPGSLDFLVLFSSAGHLLGLPGQAAYAAGNAYLDGMARHRPDTLSLAWTSWRGLGMGDSAAVDAELAARGVAPIDAERALAVWSRVPLGAREVAVLPPAPRSEPRPADPADVAAAVAEVAAAVLGVDPGRVPADRPLTELGMDSLLSVAFRVDLGRRIGTTLPATALWHHPTVSAIAAHLTQERP
ncbi:type I polyketide synthase [Actinokineospora sp. NPDC004072]